MKKSLLTLSLLVLSVGARAQFVPFVPNQILTAQALNGAFAQFLPLNGGVPVTFPQLTVTGNTTLNNLSVNGSSSFIGSTAFFGLVTLPASTILPNGVTATTQAASDNSNLVATDAFVNQHTTALTSLAAQAANTVVANVTAASASPTAVALPSCSTANSALKYTTSAGFSCGTTFALTTGTLAQFAATTSAQLAGIISDETGTGSLVFGTSPTLVTPALGTPSALVLTNATGLPVSGLTGLGTGVATALGTAATGSGGIVLATSPTISSPTITGGAYNGTVGATTPSTGAFTTLSASSTVSGAGFSTYLASPPAIGGTAPAAGSFTTVSATGTITPSQTAGIVGTTTNNNANAGSVGETITSSVTGVAQTSATLTNVTSIPLTAGDWDVTCSWTGSGSSGTTSLNFGLTTTTGAQAPVGQRVLLGGFSTTVGVEMACPTFRLSLASSATLFLTSAPAFAGTMTVGGTIWARRRR